MKICPVGAELFLGDRQTDRHDKANSHFLQFCKHAKKWILRKYNGECGLNSYGSGSG
jgi:hypothetical protein